MTVLPRAAFAILLFLAVPEIRADDAGPTNEPPPDFGGADFGGLGKSCPSFRCTGGSPVPKARPKFVSKGCGKMGGGMMMMMGGGGGEKYAPCCDLWHACYQTCGAAKKACDDAFKSCSEVTCGGDTKCEKDAEMKAMMLNLGGCQLYDESQYHACECVRKDKAPEKRAAALRYFYKKFAPDNVDKVDALMKKADSTAKLAGLFRKLHARYPASIKVEVDDEMARMQEMMRKAGLPKEEKGGGAAGGGAAGDGAAGDDAEGDDEDDGDVLEMDEL